MIRLRVPAGRASARGGNVRRNAIRGPGRLVLVP
jgi:hypothetical protein